MESPRLSFKGYKFSEALFRNKDSVKQLIAVAGAVNFAIGFDWKTFLITVGAALFAFGLKMIQDAVDFYFSVVKVD